MNSLLLIFIVAAVLLLFWLVAEYNFFVSAKARIKASVQEIGNQLKRQSELIPNLEVSVKRYLKHETDILKMLSEARKTIAQGKDAGKQIGDVLSKLQIVVESNPELKADNVVAKLMDELRDTSDKVMYARRLLIDLSADYNVKRVTFPSSVIASIFKFEEMQGLATDEKGQHLEVSSSELKTPKINI